MSSEHVLSVHVREIKAPILKGVVFATTHCFAKNICFRWRNFILFSRVIRLDLLLNNVVFVTNDLGGQ